MPRLSNDQLVELCSRPYESLTPGQRKSARAFKRRQINDEALSMEAERVLEDQPQMSVTKAYYAVMNLAVKKEIAKTEEKKPAPQPAPVKPPTTKEEYLKAIGLTKDKPAASPETDVTKVRIKPATVEGLRILAGGWPDDIETVPRVQESKWSKPARILKQYPGCVFVIGDRLSWSSATAIRRRIRNGEIKAFTPKGAYRCEVAPDHEHEDAYRVLASYQGDQK